MPRLRIRKTSLKAMNLIHNIVFYYLKPPKKIVLIMCSMRSGSTLLKALLAKAPDVSHLPEINYRQYLINKYSFYYKVYDLSKKKIILLKRPEWLVNPAEYKIFPDKRMKIILLIRNVHDVVISLEQIKKIGMFTEYTRDDFINYWYKTYDGLNRLLKSYHGEVYRVFYEDLIRDPKSVTKSLFGFIGSVQEEGIDQYDKPENFDWQWGTDDCSDDIKSLRVVQEKKMTIADNKSILSIVQRFPQVQKLCNEFGYL